MKQIARPIRTLLSLHEPSHDGARPWLPRGARVHNGMRQSLKGFRT